MFGLGGVLGTGLALIALEVFVTSSQQGAIASLFAVPGRLASAWMDPTRPLIANKSGATLTASTSTTSASSSTSTAPSTLTSAM